MRDDGGVMEDEGRVMEGVGWWRMWGEGGVV